MATSYHRNCVNCGRRIQMRRMPAGQWLPFEGYDVVHVCGSSAPIDSHQPHHENRASPARGGRTNSTEGYENLSFLDFTLPSQSITESSRETQSVGSRRRKARSISAASAPGRTSRGVASQDRGAPFYPRRKATATHHSQVNQGVVPPGSKSKRNAALIVLVPVVALIATYLILSHRAQNAPPSMSSRQEAAPTPHITPNEPKFVTAGEYYEQGLALTKAKKYEEAASAYQQAIAQDPRLAQAHHELGYAYIQLGQWNNAVASLQEAAALRPDFADSRRLLGDALTMLRRWQPAVESYNEAIRLQPDAIAAHLGLANVYKHTNQLTDAVDAYVKVIKLRPNYAPAHYELGLLYAALGDLDAAAAEYEVLLPLNAKLAEKLNQEISKD